MEDDSCQQPILQAIGNQKLHLLLVVAGLQHYDTLKTLDRKLVRQQLEVNAVGPLFLVQALQQNLADSAKVNSAWHGEQNKLSWPCIKGSVSFADTGCVTCQPYGLTDTS